MPTTFAELGVPADMLAHLHDRGITVPTPIQEATLGDLLAGEDVCGGAPTGSGKTLAFGIPLVAGIERARPHHPRAVVLAPTRELAGQIHAVLEPLAALRGLRVASIYGGVGFVPQVRALRQGVEILVACPGRLEDLLQQGVVLLNDVQVVVVDEADRMADMGFLPAVVRILDLTPAQRQTVLFSATLDKAVDKLIRTHLRDPRRHIIAVSEDDAARTTHLFWSVGKDQRVGVCADVARTAGRTIVFTRTKHGADRLARQLGTFGVAAAPIHGNRSQAQRERALAEFHAGHVTALVATDVAARGIHVDEVGCVVHFDPPASAPDYLHRSGRTARAGASGVVVSLVLDEVRSAVRGLQRELGQRNGLTRPEMTLIPEGEVVVTPLPKPRAERTDDTRNGQRPGRKPRPSRDARPPRGPRTGRDRRPAPPQPESRSAAGRTSGSVASEGPRLRPSRTSGPVAARRAGRSDRQTRRGR